LLEDLADADLLTHLRANLVGNRLQDVLELVVGLVDVAGNGPDQLEAVKERGDGLLDHLELAAGDVLKLTLKSVQELHKVLRLGMLLLESLLLSVETVQVVVVRILLENLHEYLN
jgi:hypothetical protein